MDLAAERVRAQLANSVTPIAKPVSLTELHHLYHRGNDRRPLPPNRAHQTIINLVRTEARWRNFCDSFNDPKGRDWKTLLRALCWEERGIVDAFARWFVRREGSRVTAESSARRYLRDLSALFFRYQGFELEKRLRDHMRQIAKVELTPLFGLRVEPKHKNILGPRGFTYLVHFTWVRSRRPFKIGLDRIDDVFCRMILMWTGCRSHELVQTSSDTGQYKQKFDEESDAYTDIDDGPDQYVAKRPKRCWACGGIDDRTLPSRKVLCWEDITVLILSDPGNSGGRDMFAMDILLRFHKGHNNQTVPTIYHFIEDPYPLLCPIVYILGKACAEDVIDWDALQIDTSNLQIDEIIKNLFNTKLQEPSVEIPWKKKYWHTPVFRKTDLGPDGRPLKINSPITKAILDNNVKNQGMEAGLPDRPQSYDYRRGNLELLDTHYRTSVRNRGARHRPGTNVYETSYVGQGMRAISQDAFLGRGAHSPLIDILNHVGLRYDESAPTKVTEEMMRLVGPDSTMVRLEGELSTLRERLLEKYGKVSYAPITDQAAYKDVQCQAKAAKQRYSRKVLDLFRKDHFTTKNNVELGRQLNGEGQLDSSQRIRTVYFTVPERRRLAALFGDFDDNPSEEIITQKKIDATLALIRYAWVVEKDDQALLLDLVSNTTEECLPKKRPWFASMIREPVSLPARITEPQRQASPRNSGPASSDLPIGFTCIFCGKVVRRKATMWTCVDKHITKLLSNTGTVPCPYPGCEMKDAHSNEMLFKNHAYLEHGIALRPIKQTRNIMESLETDPLCDESTSTRFNESEKEVIAKDDPHDWEIGAYHTGTTQHSLSQYPAFPKDNPPHTGFCTESGGLMILPEEDSNSSKDMQMHSSDHWDSQGFISRSSQELELYGDQLPVRSDTMEAFGNAETQFAPISPLYGRPGCTDTWSESIPSSFDAELLDPLLREVDAPTSSTVQVQNLEPEQEVSSINDATDYPVECLVEKRGNMFYVQWKDGSLSWQSREQISDDLTKPFEASWKGYHRGVTVLYRKTTGTAPFRIKFKDWPWGNAAAWATPKQLCPDLVSQWPICSKQAN
ncbi:uncharacterized protein E0L32_007822 [Thyridium curvatum]|uniref:Uncharacterized protein n=1 Tax=Thyridium curvatum TaxID=1093900 RepID=A0A507AUJ3_9PEZI|nr:uncharacterized protein E0L32_007822 [Thyridium curvatum]TPX11403.1 hypothetical protein E0L32_007822 [Thyridium curvatum]